MNATVRFSIVGIFVILFVSALYLAKGFFLPIVVAVLLALTMSPIVRFFTRRGVPAPLPAVLLVSILLGLGVLSVYTLIIPMADWLDRAPEIGAQLKEKLAFLRDPLLAVQDAQQEVEAATAGVDGPAQKVQIDGPGFFANAANSLVVGVTMLVITLVLLIFLLASGDMFYAKLVQTFDAMTDKKRALRIARDIERDVSRYLFTITLINTTLGIVIAAGLYVLDMPTPYIWGAVAALANFMPYVGAILGLGAATAVALVSFDSLGPVLTIAGFYFMCTFIEGQFMTPTIVGRRLELNAVSVFLSVAFWAWMWGIVGALIAVPMLVILKTICDHIEGLDTLGRFLSNDDGEKGDASSER